MNHFIWGIFGPGKIAGSFAENFKFAKNAIHRLGAVVSHNPAYAKKFAAQYIVSSVYERMEDFLHDGTIDAVLISHTLYKACKGDLDLPGEPISGIV